MKVIFEKLGSRQSFYFRMSR